MVAYLLATSETSRDSWHTAAVIGHWNSSKIFPLTAADVDQLKEKDTYCLPASDRDDLTGRLTTDQNRVLFDELALFPQLQYKLYLLVCTLWHASVVDKFLTQATIASSLFCLDKNPQSDLQKAAASYSSKIYTTSPPYAIC
jgi:hypothetical protein